MLAGPYRMSALDRGAELESLVEPDGFARALSAHRRRAKIGLIGCFLAVFTVFCVNLIAEDVGVMRRFRASPAQAVIPLRAMTIQPRIWALTSPAIREQDATFERCFESAIGEPLAADPSCVRMPPQRVD